MNVRDGLLSNDTYCFALDLNLHWQDDDHSDWDMEDWHDEAEDDAVEILEKVLLIIIISLRVYSFILTKR